MKKNTNQGVVMPRYFPIQKIFTHSCYVFFFFGTVCPANTLVKGLENA